MEIYILDVGTKKYGDCIVIVQDSKVIMIDAAHPGDQELLLKQLKKILKKDAPFDIDLFVITHCHLDHIGCAPTLIKNGSIVPAMALVADEKLGFGRTDDGEGPTDDPGLTTTQKAMMMALQEEDHSALPDNELAQFIQDAITLEERYITMLETMDNNGCEIVRYGAHTPQQIKKIETAFKKFGLKILGPSEEHLATCAQAIAGVSDAVSEDEFNSLSDDLSKEDLVDRYRRIMREVKTDAGLEDSESQASAAKNDQSIVLKVAANGWSALLAGDMQYASAGVDGMDELMEIALQEAADAGPYDFVKITHHTASNGLNQEVFDAFKPCRNFVHTGGIDDATHPNKKAIAVLKSNASSIKFLRTDRNGMITVKKDGQVVMTKTKGRFNDFTLNTASDAELPANVEKEIPEVQSEIVRQDSNGYVEVIAKIPVGTPKVTITVEIDTEKKKSEPVIEGPNDNKPRKDFALGGGREFPELLFVTCTERLKRNIGEQETKTAFSLIRKCETATLLEIDSFDDAGEASKPVLARLRNGNFEGVVIVGGYDVVPARALDVLDKTLRENIIRMKGKKDLDNFIVWSDDIYADLDGDLFPELPVSRIPDGRVGKLLIAALLAPSFNPGKRFGVRNIERPYAEEVYQLVTGSVNEMFVSEKFGPSQIQKDDAAGAVYFMLHGFERDATLYSGESLDDSTDNQLYDAISIENVPADASGTVVFAGCCWGALTVFPKASLIDKHVLSPKLPEDSIALTYLLNGAQAFVGCTGTHYSPGQPPYDYYGKPMHDSFWRQIEAGMSPAQALWEAKKIYSQDLPHNQMDLFSRGIEHKTLRQFTCLGLGW